MWVCFWNGYIFNAIGEEGGRTGLLLHRARRCCRRTACGGHPAPLCWRPGEVAASGEEEEGHGGGAGFSCLVMNCVSLIPAGLSVPGLTCASLLVWGFAQFIAGV